MLEKPILNAIRISILSALVCLGANAPSAKAGITAKATAARAMTSDEVFRIYKNRSWIWKSGVGYFWGNGMKFQAWVGHRKKAMIADGTWRVNGRGWMCFIAQWATMREDVFARNCYAHRTDGRNIYSRELPAGKWYIFKHSPIRSYDEFRKLKRGDHITRKYSRNRQRVMRVKPRKSYRFATSLDVFLSSLFGVFPSKTKP